MDTHPAPTGATEQRISVRLIDVPVDPPIGQLTPRELVVLEQMSRGLSASAAAAETHHAPGTIHTHLKAARWKLAAENTTHAGAIAIRRGLL
jgi:DNA-binding NarL/FixJ family response regulator